MIKSLTLENWKTHHNTRLDFAKGTNVIVGKMGSGKSSVLDAISFALYGTFPSLAARKVTLEETIMSRPRKQEGAKVALEFEYAGKSYVVERIVKRNGTNEASLREGGKMIAGPKISDVTKKVSEILESGYDLFSRAIYSEQNQIDFFLKLSASQRKEKLDELLGLDKYEAARSNSVTLATRMKKGAEEKKKFAQEQLKKNDPEKIENYSKSIAQKRGEMTGLAKDFDVAQKNITEQETQISKLEGAEREFRGAKEKHIRAKSFAEQLESQVKRLEKRLEGTSHEGAASELAQKKTALEQLAAKLKENDAVRKQADAKTVSLKEKKAAAAGMLKEAERRIANAATLGAECPVCRKPVSGHDKQALAAELEAEKQKHATEFAQADGQITESNKIFYGLEKERSISEQTRDKLREEISALEKIADAARELAEKKGEKTRAENDAKKAESEMAGCKFDESELTSRRRKLSEEKSNSAKLRAELGGIKTLITEMEKSLEIMESGVRSAQALVLEALESEKNAQKLSMFTSALMATQEELRHEMIGNINDAMQEIWPGVYPYTDISGVKISAEDGSYEILACQQGGEWVRVEGILSGGERSSVAITLRVALSLVLTQNLGWIMLDEPTHNLDAAAVKELCATLGVKLPELIGQIFIITHERAMEGAASGKLYAFEREKGEDGPTRIV